MKKIILISVVGFVSFSATAQEKDNTTVKTDAPIEAAQPASPQPAPVQTVAPAPVAAPDISKPTLRISEAALIPFVLNPQNFFDNSVKALVPSTFKYADADFIKEKFPNKAQNTPKVVMTDGTKRAILALNITQNTGDRQSIVHFFRDVKNDIRTQYPTSHFLKTDVLHGRSLGFVEVILPNQDGENIYNMMAFRYVGDKFFFLNFTCPEEDMAKWPERCARNCR